MYVYLSEWERDEVKINNANSELLIIYISKTIDFKEKLLKEIFIRNELKKMVRTKKQF